VPLIPSSLRVLTDCTYSKNVLTVLSSVRYFSDMGQKTSKNDSSVASSPSGCPIRHDKSHEPTANLSQCPVDHAKVNPLNQMPSLAQEPAQNQSVPLPTSRTESSIPRDPSSKWEYPSPQQFYNALVRKGWETPEESVETMVEIHNFLNERAWLEVLKWERRQNR